MRRTRLAVVFFAAVLATPSLVRAQFSLDATPTPASGATPTPTPTAIPVDPIAPEVDLTVPGLDATPAPTATPKPPQTPSTAGAYDPGLPGQWGYPGALRVVAASPGDPGVTQFAAGVEFFSEPGFIVKGKNHRRTMNTLAFDHAVSRNLAASVVVLSMANHSAATNPLYIAALGDLDLSARLSFPLFESDTSRFTAGLRGGAKIMQGDGPGKAVGDAASPYLRGLATYDTPVFRFAADAGYFVDRSSALVPKDTEPDAGQLYAYGVSDYNAILAGAAVDFPAWRVSPFAEITARVDLGGEGEPATIGTGGLKISNASRRMSLLAALDYGLSGKKVEEGRLRVPTWNAVGGFSYSFGAGGPRPARVRRVVVKKDPNEGKALPVEGTTESTGRLKGKVIAMATRTGIANATVAIEGGPTLTTDATGAFDLQGINAGTARIDVKAPGYQARKSTSYVTAGQITSVVLYLFAAPVAPAVAAPEPQPASVRGKVVSTKGKPLAATVAASYAGRTKEVKTDAKGAYKLDLVEGDYSITITAPGMKPQTHNGKLAAKESFELDFMLLTDKKKTPAGTAPKKDTTAKKPK